MGLADMRVLDLFCGAGGLSQGFRDEGFSITGVDNNPYSREIFLENRIGEFIEIDLVKESIGDTFDVIVGGPPCRPWSCINLQKRGSVHQDYILLDRFFEHIVARKPRAFLLENVLPLGQDARFQELVRSTAHEGYTIEFRTVRYSDYGATTRRQRLIAVGFRDFGLSTREFFERLDQMRKPPLTVGQAIKRYEDLESNGYPDHEWPNLTTIDKYQEYYDSGKYGWCRLEYGDVAPSFGNIMKTYILHPLAGKNGYPLRVISVREALEIMGFPGSFKFPSGMGMSMKYQMVANSVSPVVAGKMARVIRYMLQSRSFL